MLLHVWIIPQLRRWWSCHRGQDQSSYRMFMQMQAGRRRPRSGGRCRPKCWPHTLSWRRPPWQTLSSRVRSRVAGAMRSPAQRGSCTIENPQQVT